MAIKGEISVCPCWQLFGLQLFQVAIMQVVVVLQPNNFLDNVHMSKQLRTASNINAEVGRSLCKCFIIKRIWKATSMQVCDQKSTM